MEIKVKTWEEENKKIKKEYKENLKKEIINELKFEKEEKIKSFVCPIIYRQDPNNYKKFIISNDNKEILKQLNFLISPSKSLKFELLFNSNEYEYLDNQQSEYPKNFHNYCNGKCSTVTIVYGTNNHILVVM